MTAVHPLALVLLGLAIPILATYLRRRKQRTKQVPSLVLLRALRGMPTTTARARARARPSHLTSLALVLASLLGIVIALTDPKRATEQARDWVVVLDTSASMGAVMPGTASSRLDTARALLGVFLDRLDPDDRVALLVSGDRSSVAAQWTSNHSRIRSLAQTAVPRGDSAAMTRSLHLADAMARSGRRGQLVLLSDGVGVSIPPLRSPFEHMVVGVPGPNIGIHALAVREADTLGLSEIYIGLTSQSHRMHDVDVTLYIDQTVVDVLSMTVPAIGSIERLHRIELPEGGPLRASLHRAPEDILSLDDSAEIKRLAGQRVTVLLVAKTRRSFLSEALREHPRVTLTVIGPNDRPPATNFDLLVLEADYEAAPLPQASNILAFGTRPQSVGIEATTTVTGPEILRWSFDSPLFRFVDFRDLQLSDGISLLPHDGDESMIDTDTGSLAILRRSPQRNVLYFGFSATDSDLVLRVAFVNLIANVIEWATPGSGENGSGPSSDAARFTSFTGAASESQLAPLASRLPDDAPAFRQPPPLETDGWRWLAAFSLVTLLIEGALGPARSWLRRRARDRGRP